jgi:hypothetical protein
MAKRTAEMFLSIRLLRNNNNERCSTLIKIDSTINIPNMCLVDLSSSSVGLDVCANERRVHDRCAGDGGLNIMVYVNSNAVIWRVLVRTTPLKYGRVPRSLRFKVPEERLLDVSDCILQVPNP